MFFKIIYKDKIFKEIIKIIFFIFILVILNLLIPNITHSSQFSPAIKVNNIFISKYEINERKKLLIALGTSELEAKKFAEENLINETLQKMHAKIIGVKVSKSQIEEVFNNFISIRSLSKSSLNKSLRKFGATVEELRSYLEANVLMRNIIKSTFYSQMSMEDFDFSLFRPSASISIPTQINISEMIIPFSIRGKENTIKLGERILKDLKQGKNFQKLAKRFSQSPSVNDGGMIGYIPIETLPEGLKDILTKLKSGMHSELIVTPDSVMIFKVNSWKNSEKSKNPPNEVTYAILPKNYDHENVCKSITQEKIKGPIKSNKLSKKIRDNLNQLRPSEKILFSDKNGDQKQLILCTRRLILSENSIKLLQGQMLEKKLMKLAEGLNLELKRTAQILYIK